MEHEQQWEVGLRQDYCPPLFQVTLCPPKPVSSPTQASTHVPIAFADRAKNDCGHCLCTHTLLEELPLHQPCSPHSPPSIGEPNLCLPTGQIKGPAQEWGAGDSETCWLSGVELDTESEHGPEFALE